jgi:hypothetical protein
MQTKQPTEPNQSKAFNKTISPYPSSSSKHKVDKSVLLFQRRGATLFLSPSSPYLITVLMPRDILMENRPLGAKQYPYPSRPFCL